MKVKITRISLFQKVLPYCSGSLAIGDLSENRTKSFDTFISSVVVIDTDLGVSGVGESCPWVSDNFNEMEVYNCLASRLLGEDPLKLQGIVKNMDAVIQGHTFAKSAVDMACWDIKAKNRGVPLYELLGGKLTDGSPLYRCVMEQEHDKIKTEMEQYRASGYKYFKLRVGIEPDKDIELIKFASSLAEPGEIVYADANCRWKLSEALEIVKAIEGLDVMIEQPCLSYEDCINVRKNTGLFIKLDELVTDLSMAKKIVQDRSADVVCIKMSRVGGLTKALEIRDFFVSEGIKVVTECMMGGEIVAAAVSHFSASTPPEFLFNTGDLDAYVTASTGNVSPPTLNGRIYCHNTPGLGVEPDLASLGAPVAIYENYNN
jgi:L-alanine-DL-glutamate epimerase-like enolase superfamily enzyme